MHIFYYRTIIIAIMITISCISRSIIASAINI